MNLNFNVKTDIDPKALRERALEEALQIHRNPSTRKNRSIQEITSTCMYGHAAELFLISQGFIDDHRPFKDLFDMNGTSIEVKVTQCENYVPYVLKRCADKIINSPWMNHPKEVYVFINNKKDFEYIFNGSYTWNESSLQFDKNDV